MEIRRRAWAAAIAASISIMFGLPLVFGVLPLFLKPISADLGWGRATLSLLYFGSAMGILLVAPLIGRAVDRWGARRSALIGSIVFGLTIMGLSRLTPSLPLLVVMGFVLGCSAAAKGPVPYAKVIAALFYSNRGLVLALALGVASNIGLVGAPYFGHFVLTHVGWRQAFVVSGIVSLSVNAVAVIFLPSISRKAVGHPGQFPGPATHEEGVTARQALTSRTFWMVAGAAVVTIGGLSGLQQHMAALLDDRGFKSNIVLAALAAGPLVGAPSYFVAGFVLDRIQTPRIVVPFFVAACVGVALIAYSTSATALIVGVAILGVANAAEVAIAPYLLSRYFGLHSFSEIFGYFTALVGSCSAAAPLLLGLYYDSFHSYEFALLIMLVAFMICAAMVALLPPYVYQVGRLEQGTDE